MQQQHLLVDDTTEGEAIDQMLDYFSKGKFARALSLINRTFPVTFRFANRQLLHVIFNAIDLMEDEVLSTLYERDYVEALSSIDRTFSATFRFSDRHLLHVLLDEATIMAGSSFLHDRVKVECFSELGKVVAAVVERDAELAMAKRTDDDSIDFDGLDIVDREALIGSIGMLPIHRATLGRRNILVTKTVPLPLQLPQTIVAAYQKP